MQNEARAAGAMPPYDSYAPAGPGASRHCTRREGVVRWGANRANERGRSPRDFGGVGARSDRRSRLASGHR
jgi:hypothetical protein